MVNRSGKVLPQVLFMSATVCICLLSALFSSSVFSQSSVRQGTAEDIHRHADSNVFVSPMVLSQSLKDLCKGLPIDREGIWKSYSYREYICDNVSLNQLDFGLQKKKRWLAPKLSIWASIFTREPRDKLVDLKLDFYSGNKWLCCLVIRDIDAEEGKDTVAEKEIDCPAELINCQDEPGVVITISVKDNG